MVLHDITPEYISRYVNFYYGKEDWIYTPNGEECMAKLQAEGAAKIWNLLLKHNVALLADEVGTGKTIQALAVLITLWRQKPNAKVLLYTPNETVSSKWGREYTNFIRSHYRFSDDLIKSSLTGEPLRKSINCESHLKLLQELNQQWPSFLIGKISSLSNFLSPKLSEEALADVGISVNRPFEIEKSKDEKERRDWMCQMGAKSNQRIYQLFPYQEEAPIDLLIVDEAHYLRRTDTDSNRSVAAHAFFQRQNIDAKNGPQPQFPLAKRVLLMTATPNHTAAQDVVNVVSLFKPALKNAKPEEILNQICVRRFRRLQGKNKFQYRQEVPVGVELNTIAEKLFFAAYQKNLVVHQSQKKDEKNINPYKILFGYLEGFEFLGNSTPDRRPVKVAADTDREETGKDFEDSQDTKAIQQVVDCFQKAYNTPPKHPKYDKLIEQLSPNVATDFYNKEKTLVFVRRIPSVREISHRLIREYDTWLLHVLGDIIPADKKKKRNELRKYFYALGRGHEEELPVVDSNPPEKGTEHIPNSRVLDLFVKKNEGDYKTTDCSNFRQRFTINLQVFSLFFQPAGDYKTARYTARELYYKEEGGKKKYHYKDSFIRERLENSGNEGIIGQLKGLYGLGNNLSLDGAKKNSEELDTLLGIWRRKAYAAPLQSKVADAIAEYDTWSELEKEGFANFLEKGVLFSSPFIVHLYAIYRKVLFHPKDKKKRLQGEALYRRFCKAVDTKLESSGLAHLITEAVLSFRFFYQKEYSKKESELVQESWSFFNFTIPVYPYAAHTARESILKAFNTPFFPNVLVATSILQEGVDLHLQCSNIVHYGIAWTQGDNEQRVGRVDRMFGKLDKALGKNPNTVLPIQYPYLKNTVDQDQLSRFILRKYYAEQLIDKMKNVEVSKEVNFLERIDGEWLKLFRSPSEDIEIEEPFDVHPADFSFATISEQDIKPKPRKVIDFIIGSLKKHFGSEVVAFSDDTISYTKEIAAIKHVRADGRNQPVLVELDYYEPGIHLIHAPTYCLTLKSPLGKFERDFTDLRRYGSLLEAYKAKPYLKLCLDESKKRTPFKMYSRCDLPLILDGNDEEFNISEDELIHLVKELIQFSDDLEWQLLQTDLENEAVVKAEGNDLKPTGFLPNNRVTQVPVGWKKGDADRVVFKETIYNYKEDLLDVYRFNHFNPFVRWINAGSVFYGQVALYKSDALPKEVALLEKVLKA